MHGLILQYPNSTSARLLAQRRSRDCSVSERCTQTPAARAFCCTGVDGAAMASHSDDFNNFLAHVYDVWATLATAELASSKTLADASRLGLLRITLTVLSILLPVGLCN